MGLCVEQTPELAVAVLGIFKSGGALLALDPAHPPARRAFLLEDSGGAGAGDAHLLPLLPPFEAWDLPGELEEDRGPSSDHRISRLSTVGSVRAPPKPSRGGRPGRASPT